MLRGHTTFRCHACGNKFTGFNTEWRATALTTPVHCPKCGSWHTAPAYTPFAQLIYRNIWKSMEAGENTSDE